MRKRLTKDQVLTIPNGMSLFRLVLIPAIVWTFRQGHSYIAVGLVALSALTDILDGVVARKFNMVSDVGKVLDPIADKLTQAALLLCLIVYHRRVLILFLLLVVKETLLLIFGGLTVKKRNAVHSAQWHGKLCTVVFECTMVVFMLFPELPEKAFDVMTLVCAGVMIFSLVMYLTFYIGVIRGKRQG